LGRLLPNEPRILLPLAVLMSPLPIFAPHVWRPCAGRVSQRN
jgi:hypothetical protein